MAKPRPGSRRPPAELRKANSFDDPHRTAWFLPRSRTRTATRPAGLRSELNEEQKKKVLALLKTGTSATGYEQATTIMSLEEILRDTEKKGTMVRNPNWYYVSIFGKPSKTGRWGWRIEGHHLSVSFTVDRGQIESPTPFFFGANPATVKAGPRTGPDAPEVEDLAGTGEVARRGPKKSAFPGAKRSRRLVRTRRRPSWAIHWRRGCQSSRTNSAGP